MFNTEASSTTSLLTPHRPKQLKGSTVDFSGIIWALVFGGMSMGKAGLCRLSMEPLGVNPSLARDLKQIDTLCFGVDAFVFPEQLEH